MNGQLVVVLTNQLLSRYLQLTLHTCDFYLAHIIDDKLNTIHIHLNISIHIDGSIHPRTHSIT